MRAVAVDASDHGDGGGPSKPTGKQAVFAQRGVYIILASNFSAK